MVNSSEISVNHCGRSITIHNHNIISIKDPLETGLVVPSSVAP
jgi:hypothetical protein